jgi:hypothetical protein
MNEEEKVVSLNDLEFDGETCFFEGPLLGVFVLIIMKMGKKKMKYIS